ncbi:protein PTST homolog 2, chloroplastic isoform X2 [Dendrobium catenatum]|uniref:protein PTST homolog 2, chloroplastic isoform X2 n=1 Tax=Dendrobium catenatum TaxID=906689 RepID=UPI0009F48FD0|nr:protein PTST homolog 2, chloroplastic isoform X2 [Dendrobium catenatum]
MTALTATHTAVLFISVSPCRRLAVRFSRRSEDATALAPLPILRHSIGRKGRRRVRGGVVWAEEELSGSRYLEAEIYEFMVRSADPMGFPSREALKAAGREDLAKAIEKEGGWLAYGWDSDEEEEEGDIGTEDSRIFQHRMAFVAGEADAALESDSDNVWDSSEDSSGTSTSRRPMDIEVSQDAGIDGILNRLEKERNLAFGFISPKEEELMIKKDESLSITALRHEFRNTVGSIESTKRCVSSNLEEGLHHHSGVQNSDNGSLMDINTDSEPETWRSWSIQRSGDPLSNFEAAEIVVEEDQRKSDINFVSRYLSGNEKENVLTDRLASGPISSGNNCPYDNDQGSLKSEIIVCLQHLELQLTSALQLCKFRSYGIHSCMDQDQESLLEQLHSLSDALEFQQNEIKNARDILRSTRAKLAVMEGKIALEVIEFQKVIEVKQLRLAAAEMSLSILRSVCIVWPNSASEVLLTGSFDGWTSQWRMEKNNTGVFSLCLKLYPGRYEIKFIVDGVWAIDLLRPITNNNGFKNNLLIVT